MISELTDDGIIAFKHENCKSAHQLKDDIGLIKTAKFVMKDNKFIVNNICLPKANSEQFGEAILSDWEVTDPKTISDDPKQEMLEYLQEDEYRLLERKTGDVLLSGSQKVILNSSSCTFVYFNKASHDKPGAE
jgi:hypothetical protein